MRGRRENGFTFSESFEKVGIAESVLYRMIEAIHENLLHSKSVGAETEKLEIKKKLTKDVLVLTTSNI